MPQEHPMTTAELTLVNNHLHLVHIIAQKFTLPWYINLSELISAGYVALIRAAQAYIGSIGKFSSFAWKCIYNAMLDEIRRFRPLSEPAPENKEYDYEHEHWNTYAGKAQPRNAEEYAEETGDWTERLGCKSNGGREAWKVVDRLKRNAGLTDREAYVIDCRYGIDCEPRSTNQIAAELGVTPQRVNQIKGEAKKKMRLAA